MSRASVSARQTGPTEMKGVGSIRMRVANTGTPLGIVAEPHTAYPRGVATGIRVTLTRPNTDPEEQRRACQNYGFLGLVTQSWSWSGRVARRPTGIHRQQLGNSGETGPAPSECRLNCTYGAWEEN